jgi:multisubunit Na+/H+ antiporter MnhE subunit
MRWVVAVLALTAVYLLMLISIDPWDIAIGLVISTALVFAFRGYLGLTAPSSGPSPVERLRALPAFVARAIWDVVTGAVQVALMVLHLRPSDDALARLGADRRRLGTTRRALPSAR